LAIDLVDVEFRAADLKARSTKGTTGTQASFLELFHGDHDKVLQLEKLVAGKLGFDKIYAVTGQTYSRKIDAQILDALSGIAQSAHKIATDLRILVAPLRRSKSRTKQVKLAHQPWRTKRNPMRCERICSLAAVTSRSLALRLSGGNTQWMERTAFGLRLARGYSITWVGGVLLWLTLTGGALI